jgi:hypothetical protein
LGLILGAVTSADTCFDRFEVTKAELHTSDYTALYKVLRKLSADGKLDAYHAGDTLFMKRSEGGEQALIEAQGEGRYSIRLNREPGFFIDPFGQRQIFYSALRRHLTSKGFRSGLRTTARRKASPEFGNPLASAFVLQRIVDNVFQQGYTCFLEIRKDGHGLLWIDPAVSVYNTFKGRYLNKAEITSANLIMAVRRWSVLEPQARLSKAQEFLAHIGEAGSLSVEYADGTRAIFSNQFARIEGQ